MSKRDRTRAQLQAVALRLFSSQGYDATTVEQIATEAGVTSMTFFRHFASKDAVLLDDPYDPIIGTAVAAQPTTLPPLERARRGFVQAWSRMPEADTEEVRERVRIVVEHPGLWARMWENNLATQRVVADALRATGSPPLQAEVAAGACLGALMAAMLDWGRTDEGTLAERVAVALDQLAPANADAAESTGVRS